MVSNAEEHILVSMFKIDRKFIQDLICILAICNNYLEVPHQLRQSVAARRVDMPDTVLVVAADRRDMVEV